MSKNSKPLISIIMLNCNGQKFLEKTIPKILKLDYPNYEFIISDNNSTDGSLKFIKKFNEIKLIENKENLGVSKGKNLGIKKARGKYILVVDNDILVNLNKKNLEDLIKFYKDNIGFIQFPILNKNNKNTIYYGIYFTLYGTNAHRPFVSIKKILDTPNKFIEIGSSASGSFFCSKKNWEEIGGFDETQTFNIDDVDIGPRAWIYGYKNYLYTKNYFIHLGVGKTERPEEYAQKFKFFFSGHARGMIKNYNLRNLILLFPIFFIFQSIKAVKYSFKKKSHTVLLAFLDSLGLFISKLPDTINQRRIVQSKRTLKDDVFLKIKPPKFN